MTEGVAFVRRNRVDERAAIGIAAIAGLAAATAGAEPTGSSTVDALLVAISVAAVVWASRWKRRTVARWTMRAMSGLRIAAR